MLLPTIANSEPASAFPLLLVEASVAFDPHRLRSNPSGLPPEERQHFLKYGINSGISSIAGALCNYLHIAKFFETFLAKLYSKT